jgi:hypothetical protein
MPIDFISTKLLYRVRDEVELPRKSGRVSYTLTLVVVLAMALGRVRAKQRELMRSLTAPVRQAT